jgi:hypothetical protein
VVPSVRTAVLQLVGRDERGGGEQLIHDGRGEAVRHRQLKVVADHVGNTEPPEGDTPIRRLCTSRRRVETGRRGRIGHARCDLGRAVDDPVIGAVGVLARVKADGATLREQATARDPLGRADIELGVPDAGSDCIVRSAVGDAAVGHKVADRVWTPGAGGVQCRVVGGVSKDVHEIRGGMEVSGGTGGRASGR